MPRRKQEAPRRAAVYEPDDDAPRSDATAAAADEDGENEAQTEDESSEKNSPKASDREPDNKSSNAYSEQNSPASVFSSQEAELESHLSDASDRLSDFKASPPRESQREDESRAAKLKEETAGSLEKMRAAYANFLSDSYWTGGGADLKAGEVASKANCDSTNGGAKGEFDWHQDALSKSLQHTLSPKPPSKPNLFSSVHLYRQSARSCGAVFTGASRFRCKDCSAAYDTLVELTVHMSKSGHYKDNNRARQSRCHASSSKSRKRSRDGDGAGDAQKVLKCLFCGDSFDALQDLSVHMIRTKHYQRVPLKEPLPVLAPKLLPPPKKRAFEPARPCSPDSTTGAPGYGDAQRAAVSSANSNRYGYQNGASYTWQFETCKSQILKCMECGSSHDTLQQLTTHMMVTGHFVKVTTSASKKGKQLALDPLAIEKIHGLTEHAAGGADSEKERDRPEEETSDRMETDRKEEEEQEEQEQEEGQEEQEEEQEEQEEEEQEEGQEEQEEEQEEQEQEEEQEEGEGASKYPYLREEDLEKPSGGGGDILKSLANTVACAITKAQTGAPSWSAYPSIHAAYQLSGIIKGATSLSAFPPAPPKQTLHHKLRPLAPKGKSQRRSADIKTEKGGISDGKERQSCRFEAAAADDDSDCQDDSSSSSKLDFVTEGGDEIKEKLSAGFCDSVKTPGAASEAAADVSDILGLNPLSALQSVLNSHLGNANKPDRAGRLAAHADSIHADMNRKDKAALAPRKRPEDSFLFVGDDQPMDLTKSKPGRPAALPASPSTPITHKYALSDIADMVEVLPKATTPKPCAASRIPATKLESDVRRFEDASAEVYAIHKRKGRQSNWNPRHLLILQAQFASSLFLTSEGKYLLSDLGPQERMHIAKFTGLSMTTISHWLANVKYQLRKTGGTKFLKSMDTGRPVFYCNDCASQFRCPASFIAHLEAHLGFHIKDMSRMPAEHRAKEEEPQPSRGAAQPAAAEEEAESKFRCKLCCRTFASNHAVKLHLSKTHSKSPDNHAQYVEAERQ